MPHFASDQAAIRYVGFWYQRNVEGFTPVAAMNRLRAGIMGRAIPLHLPARSALAETHRALRIFQTPAGNYIALCGHDGYCHHVSIPRYHASGATPRAAYLALYAELRQRHSLNHWRISQLETVEALDLLFLCMNWID